MKKLRKGIQAFTMIELLVVVSVLVILAGVVTISVRSAAATARDEIRYNDMQTLKTTMTLYAEANGGFPKEGDGFSGGWPTFLYGEICDNCPNNGSALNVMINDYLGTRMESPKHNLSVNGNYYYYDGAHICAGYPYTQPLQAVAVLIAKMEGSKYANPGEIASVCGGTDVAHFGPEYYAESQKDKTYVIILGQSAG